MHLYSVENEYECYIDSKYQRAAQVCLQDMRSYMHEKECCLRVAEKVLEEYSSVFSELKVTALVESASFIIPDEMMTLRRNIGTRYDSF